MESKLLKLAKKISASGKIIATDNIAKDYLLEDGYHDTIYVTSDGGFEAIVIGDVQSRTKGYMYLYHKNTEKRNSFPSAEKIEQLLQMVLNKNTLAEGEGKAAYFNWAEYGGLEKQKIYFSEIVLRMAMS